MAATAGWALDVPLQDAAKALENFALTKLRSQVLEHNGVRMINDAYNANPASMRAALETLSQIAVYGRRIAVVGDMRELGAMTHDAHRELGREVGNRQIDALFRAGRSCIGRRRRRTRSGRRSGVGLSGPGGVDQRLAGVLKTRRFNAHQGIARHRNGKHRHRPGV